MSGEGSGSTARKGTSSIVASPVLVGAVTVLIIIVSVFLAYNANQGLPFVPTYQLQAQIPSGANLVKGNEVRIGGFRVGVVDAVDTQTVVQDGQSKAVAVLDLKLDKKVEPLATDTQILVRTALRPRPQVRGADARDLGDDLRARRHDPARQRGRAGGVRRSAEHVRRPDAERLTRPPSRATATRSPAVGSRSTSRSRSCRTSSRA